MIARQVSEDPGFVLPQPELPALADVTEAPAGHPEPAPAQQVDEEETLARAEAERELARQRAEEEREGLG